ELRKVFHRCLLNDDLVHAKWTYIAQLRRGKKFLLEKRLCFEKVAACFLAKRNRWTNDAGRSRLHRSPMKSRSPRASARKTACSKKTSSIITSASAVPRW